jgi:hypothetical protein
MEGEGGGERCHPSVPDAAPARQLLHKRKSPPDKNMILNLSQRRPHRSPAACERIKGQGDPAFQSDDLPPEIPD